MQIKNSEIINTYNNLFDAINDLIEIELNTYSLYSSLNNIWRDGHTTLFFKYIENENVEYKKLMENIKDYVNCYKYLYDKCSYYGDKIVYNKNNLNYLNREFYNYINKLNNIISYYNNYTSSYYEFYGSTANSEKKLLIDARENLNQIKNENNRIGNSLSNYINSFIIKLGGISISNISEELFVFGIVHLPSNMTQGIFDDKEFYNIIKKLEMYNNSEKECINKIENGFKKFNNALKLDERNNIDTLQNNIIKCLKTLYNNHFKGVNYISDVIHRYEENRNKTMRERKEIGGIL